MGNISNFLGQLIVFLVGIFIQLGAVIFFKKRKDQKRIVQIIGAIIILAAAIWLGTALATQSAEQNIANVAVRVGDPSGASLSGASVVLFWDGDKLNELSDSDGVAKFDVPYSGDTDVRMFVETENYEIYEDLIVIPRDADNSVRLQIPDPESGDVVIRVIDKSNGQPVSRANVVLVVNGDTFSQATDSNGITKFSLAFPGGSADARMSVETDSYEINDQRVTLLPNKVQDVLLDSQGEQIEIARDILEPKSSETSDSLPIGAANIEFNRVISGSFLAPGQVDTYTFESKLNQSFYFDIIEGFGAASFVDLRLIDERGVEVFSHFLSRSSADPGTYTLDEGTYSLIIGNPEADKTGAYQIAIWEVPPPSKFSVAIGDLIQPQQPEAGAGEIESPGSQDWYSFEVEGNQQVYFDVVEGFGGASIMEIRLIDERGVEIFSHLLRIPAGDPGAYTLDEGTYTLIVGSPELDDTGTYQIGIFEE